MVDSYRDIQARLNKKESPPYAKLRRAKVENNGPDSYREER